MKIKRLPFSKFIFTFFLLCIMFTVSAQTDTSATIEATPSTEGLDLTALLPELEGIPGGRSPYYTYFWDLGDGHFSRSSHPVHDYAQAGNYEVKLYATNNYDPGTKPPRPVKKIHARTPGAVASIGMDEKNFLDGDQIFKLGKNTNAMPGTDIVVIVGIKPVGVHGRVYILSNEKIFDDPGFVFQSQSHYNGEKTIPDLTNALPAYAASDINSITMTRSGSPEYGEAVQKTFRKEQSLKFFKALYNSYQSVTAYEVNGKKGKSQFSFIHLAIKPGMLKDTNAMVTLTGVYFPDSSHKAYIHKLDIPVVASHDPNRISLKQTRLSYRTTAKRKKLTFKVQFQNDGKGDAKNIRLEMSLPRVMDRQSFKLLNIYPRIPPCSDSVITGCWYTEPRGEDSLVFYFKGISLPGSRAKEEVAYDSTQGFIRFSMRAGKRLPNKPFKGRTGIFFDKNEPVMTNYATGRFRKSLSPIAFLGYDFVTSGNATSGQNKIPFKYKKNVQLGIGLAPLAPYKKFFWQVELRANYYEQNAAQYGILKPGEVMIDRVWYGYKEYDSKHHKENLRLRLSVLPLKYNINSWISLGAGAEASVNFNISNEKENVYHTPGPGGIVLRPLVTKDKRDANSPIHFAPVVDLNFGRVYLGPSLGIRYHFGINDFSSVGTYLCWRF